MHEIVGMIFKCISIVCYEKDGFTETTINRVCKDVIGVFIGNTVFIVDGIGNVCSYYKPDSNGKCESEKDIIEVLKRELENE